MNILRIFKRKKSQPLEAPEAQAQPKNPIQEQHNEEMRRRAKRDPYDWQSGWRNPLTNKEPKRRLILEAGVSSARLWLFINGDMDNPVRASADANRHVYINLGRVGDGMGSETGNVKAENYVTYDPLHVVKSRRFWKYHPEDIMLSDRSGPIETRGSYSPFVP